ncbi:MAG: DegT/DnrJ/EryC1/StrS family aminotransferase, partial [Armatimonadetes bacterium]|nr:DegT/DnrJ/EryC1/StrS family aminotransferase [Armatimonadota bacterium]
MSRLAIDGGTPVRAVPLKAPPRQIGDLEWEQLKRVFEAQTMNRWSGGKLVDEFEENFAAFYGRRLAVASTSGTSAIHVAVGAINPEPGDEIITAPITDLGTVIPILAQNAIPVFADVDVESFNLDPDDVEQRITPRTRAIIAVHLGGNPCDMDRLLALGARHSIPVIEDCSQTYCASHRGKWTGQMGLFGCFSLQQSKHMTTGDGGITITDDVELGEKAKKFGAKGRPLYTPDGARHYHSFGFNYNMTELQAAVALGQLQRLRSVTETRTQRGELLTRLVPELPGVHPQKVLPECHSTYWFYAMRLVEAEAGMSPRRFADCMRAEGVGCGVHYIGKPIFLYESIRTKQVYGTSNYPWSLQDPAQAVRYEEGECPNTERALN